MSKDNFTKLAKMFKEREPFIPPNLTTGVIINPPPNPKIKLNETIILDKDELVFSAHLLKGYQRRLRFIEENWGETTLVNDGGQGASSHRHYVNLTDNDTLIEWTDTLKTGDEVILIPVNDQQLYYVVDKAVKF